MLDAFKNMTGGTGKQAQKQTEELELLIASAKEERGALSAMLTALTARTAKLTPMTKSLEQVTDTAASITTRLDDIAARLATLDDRTKELAEVDKRIQALKEAARQAEQTTQKAIGPDGELQKHREAVQHLSSQALQTQASLEELDRCVRDGPMVGVKLWVARHCYAPELDPITERATTLKACIRTITVTNWTNLRLRGF